MFNFIVVAYEQKPPHNVEDIILNANDNEFTRNIERTFQCSRFLSEFLHVLHSFTSYVT